MYACLAGDRAARPGMASYEAARGELRLFTLESSRGSFWGMLARIHYSAKYYDPGLWPLREAELAAARAWLDYSLFYPGRGSMTSPRSASSRNC